MPFRFQIWRLQWCWKYSLFQLSFVHFICYIFCSEKKKYESVFKNSNLWCITIVVSIEFKCQLNWHFWVIPLNFILDLQNNCNRVTGIVALNADQWLTEMNTLQKIACIWTLFALHLRATHFLSPFTENTFHKPPSC